MAKDIQWLRRKWKNVIWTSSPGIVREKMTPSQAKILTSGARKGGGLIFEKTCGALADDVGMCLDVRHLTARCIWSNCTVDGGHRER
eukprot:SAG11_NODE_3867_length_2180_cov_71.901970_2_plen_87_part_00